MTTTGRRFSSYTEGEFTGPVLDNRYGSEARYALFDIRDYGAAVDGVELTDCSIASGTAVLSSASYEFVAGDVGKIVGVLGAGTISGDYDTNANDGVLVSSILSVAGGDATLANNAVNTVTATGVVAFGTADDAAVSAAQDAVVANGGGSVFFPPGRTVVAGTLLPVEDYVSWSGAGREVSWVEVIKSASGDTSNASWLTASPHTEADPLTGCDVHDFGVEARCMIRPGGFTTGLKPLNFYNVKRCSIWNMNVWNTPATSIPFDKAQEQCAILFNVIKNPGRLWDGSAGGSGIGVGTVNLDDNMPMLIQGNSIIGVGNSATVPNGNHGIFVEGQSGGSIATGTRQVRIVDNSITGMHIGIADRGSTQTIIAGNQIRDCEYGVYVGPSVIGGSFAGLRTQIHDNVIANTVNPAASGYGHAIVIRGESSGASNYEVSVKDNVIAGCAGRAILIENAAGGSSRRMAIIQGNQITAAVLSGIYLMISGTSTGLQVHILDNVFGPAVGSGLTTGDQAAITVAGSINGLAVIRGNISGTTRGLHILSGVTVSSSTIIVDNDFGTVVNAGTNSALMFRNRGYAASLPTVTGSRGSNAALASLLTTLATLGIIVDSTS